MPDFNPKFLNHFQQLINIQIEEESPFIFSVLGDILRPIGRIVPDTKALAVESENHRITALVQTFLKESPLPLS
jgi:hypothetical protein